MLWITRLDRYGRVPRLSLDEFAGRPAGTVEITAEDGTFTIETEEPGEGEVLVSLPSAPLPPATALVVVDGETEIVEDHIGSILYDPQGAPVVIDTLGPLPAGLVADPPPPASALATITRAAGAWQVEEPIGPMKVSAMARVLAMANDLTGRVTRQYPAAEVVSWPTQDAEARAVLAGGTAADAPLLAALAAGTGATLQAYATSVLAKSSAYRAILVAAKALRDAAQAGLADADTPAEIEAVVQAAREAVDSAITQFGLSS